MNLAVVGANGMLGQDLNRAAQVRGITMAGFDLPEIDLCRPDSLAVLPAVDAVINCAAYTRVDDAETDREPAWRINAEGAGNLARWCAAHAIPLIHISTDYVYNGRKGSPYVETDDTDPLSYYGQSKLGGEVEVQRAGGKTCIVRTQSLYGVGGRNFVKAILNQILKGRTELTVVSDQVSCPTYTLHLAEGLLNLIQAQATGVVHLAAAGGCSWHEFACAIVEEVGAAVDVKPMHASSLNYPAPRPAYSVLDTSRYQSLTHATMPTWRQGLQAYLEEEPMVVELKQSNG